MDLHAATIEKQKERIRDLQMERTAASSAASTAREQVLPPRSNFLDRLTMARSCRLTVAAFYTLPISVCDS